jgi:hypothetical protein
MTDDTTRSGPPLLLAPGMSPANVGATGHGTSTDRLKGESDHGPGDGPPRAFDLEPVGSGTERVAPPGWTSLALGQAPLLAAADVERRAMPGSSTGVTIRAAPPSAAAPVLGPDGKPLPETLRTPPPSTAALAGLPHTGGRASVPGAAPPERPAPEVANPSPPEATEQPKEGFLGMITKRLFKGKGNRDGS